METFSDYVCVGDTIALAPGLRASIVYDGDSHIDDYDCHNPDQAVTGRNDKQQALLLDARQAWYDEQWFYGGVVLERQCDCGNWVTEESLWGIECNYPGNADSSYLNTVASELLAQYQARDGE